MMRRLIKGARFFAWVFGFIFYAGIRRAMIQDLREKRRLSLYLTSRLCQRFLNCLGVQVEREHWERLPSSHRPCVIVSNHLSYVDVFIIFALLPSVFVTSVEVEQTPLLGLMSKLGGSLFIERRRRFESDAQWRAMSRVLDDGFPVALFPEGTSTNGESVLPFKSSLLQAAVETKRTVLPLCIRYIKIDNEDVSAANRSLICFPPGIKFSRHLWNLLSARTIVARVTLLPVIEAPSLSSRKEAAAFAHQQIAERYLSAV